MTSNAPASGPLPDPEALDRRTLLKFLIGGGAVMVTGTGLLSACSEGDRPAADASTTSTVSTTEGIALVGERYLALVPQESDPDVLLQHLTPFAGEIPADIESQLGTLAEMVHADFEKGEVVTIDGWMLSATEGRAAALVALEN